MHLSPIEEAGLHSELRVPIQASQQQSRQGKAPKLNCFSGENSEITFDDWLPSLERVSSGTGGQRGHSYSVSWTP